MAVAAMNADRAAGGLAACFLAGIARARDWSVKQPVPRHPLPRTASPGTQHARRRAGEASAGADVWLRADRSLRRSAQAKRDGALTGGEVGTRRVRVEVFAGAGISTRPDQPAAIDTPRERQRGSLD
jgi:hypothetical protein